MAGLQVLSAPQGVPDKISVVNQPANVPAGPLKVAPPANQPAKISVAKPAVQPKISVQPLPQQPSIQVPPRPQEPPQMDKIASDIGVARGRGADDTTILYTLVQKNPQLTEPVKIAIQDRKATPSQVLDEIVKKHQPQVNSETGPGGYAPVNNPDQPGYLGMRRDNYLDPNVVFGIGKGIGQSFAKLGNFAGKTLDWLYEKVTGEKPVVPASLTDEQLTPKTAAEKIGKFAGDTTQFALGSEATKPLVASIEASTAKTALPKLSKILINTFGRSVISGGEAYGISKLQGASQEESATNALISGALPWAGTALTGLKGTAGKAANKIETSIIKPTKADLKDGFKTENVFKYDVGGTLQQTAQKTNDKIVQLSAQLNTAIKGSDSKIDVLDLLASVEKDLGGSKTKTFGANTKMTKALDFFTNELAEVSDNGVVSLSEAQQMKRAVGKLGAWYYGARDPEANAIETVANNLYTKLRTVIEQSSPKEVADINKQLSELIPIENAIIRRVPIAERGNVFGLTDIISALPAVESVKNPANWWLFAINKLSKSGRFAKVLNKASRTPETRSGAGTVIFGAGKKDAEKAVPLEPTVGLSVKNVSKAKPANLEYRGKGTVKPEQTIRVNTYTNPEYPKIKIIKPKK
jgi:hypothetical protein